MALFLVTGGCGFIGSHLTAALVGEGHRVRVLDDLSAGHPDDLPRAATLVVGDIRDPEVVRRAFDGIDGCFHLAAVVSVTLCEKQWEHAHQVNLTGALNVFREAAKRREPVPVVYASSAAVYGDVQELPAHEEMRPQPINAYGADKAACEVHAGAIARASGGSLTGLRFFNVYGSGQDPSSDYSGVVSIFCERLMKGEPVDIYGDGKQTRDFIHVFDVVQALVNAMRVAPTGGRVYNVCTGNSLAVAELARYIAELSGAHPQIRFQPARESDIRHSVGDPSLAAVELDFRARISMLEGLDELMSGLLQPRDVKAQSNPPNRVAAQ